MGTEVRDGQQFRSTSGRHHTYASSHINLNLVSIFVQQFYSCSVYRKTLRCWSDVSRAAQLSGVRGRDADATSLTFPDT